MLEQHFRAYYQKILVDPFVELLVKISFISANIITLIAAAFGFLAGISIALHWTISALILLLLSGWLDTIDGSFARATQTSSNHGSVFDIVGDRVVEFSMLFGLYLYAPTTRATAAICMLGSFFLCITSFLVVAIFTENNSNRSFYYSPGLIERAEVFVFFVLMMLLPSLFNVLAWLLTVLVLYTTVIRVKEFYQQQNYSQE